VQTLGTQSNHDLPIITNNTERIRVTATGNVGIGTAAPTERLQVSDGNIGITNTDNTARQLRLYEPSGSGSNYTAFVAQAQTGNITYTLPADLTTTNTVATGILQTDASGNLSWLNPTALGGGGAGWALTGNSITSAWDGSNGNFLGTTNAQPLVIATTNTASPQPIQVWVGNQETFRFNQPGTSAPAWSIQRGGGNQRGFHAVDLQSARSAVTQVASGDYSVIGGGQNNTASSGYATVGGGRSNTANNAYATVGGGYINAANSPFATVGGGQGNTASGNFATVGGGIANTASGNFATVGGGYSNTASGDYSAVPGGAFLQVGTRSFGFSGQTSATQTNLSANSNIAAFVDVDMWLYSRDFTNASQLRFYEAQAHSSGAEYVAFQAPNTLTTSTTYTLPADLTTATTVATGILQTDASGNLSWLTPSALVTGSAWALTGNSITGTEFLGTTNNQPLVIRTNNTERVRVTATGNVGIGTAAPTERLQVSDGNIAITNTDNTARQLRLYEPSGSGSNFTAFRAQAQGNDITYTLPASLTTTNTVATGILQTDASGNLSWLNPSALGGGGAGWALTGNSITGTEFLGTTNNQPLVIRTNNTERMRITATGNVGIGTTAPTERLQVHDGNVAITNSGTAGQLRLHTPGGTNYTAFVAQAQTGNITYTLPADLTTTNTVATGILQTDASGNLSWLNPTALGGGGAGWALTGNSITGTEFLGTTNNQPLVIRTNNTERMRVTAGGNVGVGTTNPQARLHVEDGEIWLFNNGNNTRFVIGDNPTTGQYGWLQWDSNLGLFRIDHSSAPGDGLKLNGNYVSIGNLPVNEPLKVGLGMTEFMRVTTTGNVGIGTTSPLEKLDVSNGNIGITNTDNTARQLRLYEPSGSGSNYTAFVAQAQTGNITYTLPADLTAGTLVSGGRILQSDGSGNLSWLSPTALAAATAWTLTGNSITSAWNGSSGNFLGTTNTQPLVIATTNTGSPQPIQVWVGNQETFRFNPPGSSLPAWSIQRGGGNQRGFHAVDLQSARYNSTQVASGDYSFIGGGISNTASGSNATVCGGGNNTASGSSATVGGGGGNTASGFFATVGGGNSNTASGTFSAIPGGFMLQVGDRSFGFSGQTSAGVTDLSANSSIAAFVDVDMWLYSRDRTQASQLRLYEAQAHSSGQNYVALRAPTSLSANTTYTLPASLPATSAGWLQSDNAGGMSWRPVLYGTVMVDPPNINGNTSVAFTITFGGLQTGDLVFLTPPSNLEGALIFQGANVTSPNTLTILMRNVTGAPVNGTARGWSYMVIRP
jgi:hypothetical protein